MTGRGVAVEAHRLEADGSFPNNPELPLRVYRGAVTAAGRDAVAGDEPPPDRARWRRALCVVGGGPAAVSRRLWGKVTWWMEMVVTMW